MTVPLGLSLARYVDFAMRCDEAEWFLLATRSKQLLQSQYPLWWPCEHICCSVNVGLRHFDHEPASLPTERTVAVEIAAPLSAKEHRGYLVAVLVDVVFVTCEDSCWT